MSASTICDPNQAIDPSKADDTAGADNTAKKANCCKVMTCALMGIYATAIPDLDCPSDKPVWDDVITTALPETTEAEKYTSAKTTCCIAAPTCDSITCPEGMKK